MHIQDHTTGTPFTTLSPGKLKADYGKSGDGAGYAVEDLTSKPRCFTL